MALSHAAEQRLRAAAAGGWTYDGRAQPYVTDLRALLAELDELRQPCHVDILFIRNPKETHHGH